MDLLHTCGRKSVLVHVLRQTQESSETLGWTMQPVREASRPILDKIYYVHDGGREMSEKSSSSFSMQHDAKDEKHATRAMAMIGGGADEPRKVIVKVEHPEFSRIKQQLAVLRSGKTALEKIVSQALDAQASLKAKGPEKKETEEKVKTVVAEINDCLSELRAQIVIVAALKAKDSEKFEGVHEKSTALIASATAHSDGWKILRQEL